MPNTTTKFYEKEQKQAFVPFISLSRHIMLLPFFTIRCTWIRLFVYEKNTAQIYLYTFIVQQI